MDSHIHLEEHYANVENMIRGTELSLYHVLLTAEMSSSAAVRDTVKVLHQPDMLAW